MSYTYNVHVDNLIESLDEFTWWLKRHRRTLAGVGFDVSLGILNVRPEEEEALESTTAFGKSPWTERLTGEGTDACYRHMECTFGSLKFDAVALEVQPKVCEHCGTLLLERAG